jgi:hypothetical protein
MVGITIQARITSTATAVAIGSVAQQRRLVEDLSAMRGEDLSVVCDNLCEIADAATADVSLDALDALASPASNPLRGASLSA